MSNEDIIEESGGDLFKELDDLEPGGILAYMPIMPDLDGAHNSTDRKKVAARFLPLFMIPQRHSGPLDNLKAVAEKYPEVIPEILACANELRKGDERFSWVPSESIEYRDFISALESRF